MIRSKKITNAARGQECTTRIPGFCNRNPETVVAAHPPVANGGLSYKGSDLEVAFACGCCHDVIDGRVKTDNWTEVLECWIRGSAETRAILVREGIVHV